MENKAKAIIFDFNGTLLFDEAFHTIAWGKIVEEILGTKITDTIKKRMHGGTNSAVLYSIKEDLTPEENEHYSQKKEAYYRTICLENPKQFQLVEGAITLFEFLKKEKIKFTIASASIKENIDFFIKELELDKWFDTDTIIYDDGRFEDKQGMYLEACKVLDVKPEDTIVVEDSPVGISGAIATNVKTVIGIGKKEDYQKLKLLGADTCISNYVDFPITYFK